MPAGKRVSADVVTARLGAGARCVLTFAVALIVSKQGLSVFF